MQALNSWTVRSWPESKSRVSSLANWATQVPHHIYFFFFIRKCLFFRERGGGEGRRKEAETERETQNLKQAPGSDLSAQSPSQGSNPQAVRSWREPKLTLNQLSHPGAPRFSFLPLTTLWTFETTKEAWNIFDLTNVCNQLKHLLNNVGGKEKLIDTPSILCSFHPCGPCALALHSKLWGQGHISLGLYCIPRAQNACHIECVQWKCIKPLNDQHTTIVYLWYPIGRTQNPNQFLGIFYPKLSHASSIFFSFYPRNNSK